MTIKTKCFEYYTCADRHALPEFGLLKVLHILEMPGLRHGPHDAVGLQQIVQIIDTVILRKILIFLKLLCDMSATTGNKIRIMYYIEYDSTPSTAQYRRFQVQAPRGTLFLLEVYHL